MKQQKEQKMEKDLMGWGVGLIFMGILHQISPMLSSDWGIIILVLGIITLLVRRRFMFFFLGGSLIFVGILNIASNTSSTGNFWEFFGFMQIYWGVKEIGKFYKYGNKRVVSGPVTISNTELKKDERVLV